MQRPPVRLCLLAHLGDHRLVRGEHRLVLCGERLRLVDKPQHPVAHRHRQPPHAGAHLPPQRRQPQRRRGGGACALRRAVEAAAVEVALDEREGTHQIVPQRGDLVDRRLHVGADPAGDGRHHVLHARLGEVEDALHKLGRVARHAAEVRHHLRQVDLQLVEGEARGDGVVDHLEEVVDGEAVQLPRLVVEEGAVAAEELGGVDDCRGGEGGEALLEQRRRHLQPAARRLREGRGAEAAEELLLRAGVERDAAEVVLQPVDRRGDEGAREVGEAIAKRRQLGDDPLLHLRCPVGGEADDVGDERADVRRRRREV
mmetsp:Transcript_32931/g.80041  ORF Transcript_32931/g.80041 Transcript_32931/m.80041 type:complete len:314 (+) Transcript_32931:460-1401(+)